MKTIRLFFLLMFFSNFISCKLDLDKVKLEKNNITLPENSNFKVVEKETSISDFQVESKKINFGKQSKVKVVNLNVNYYDIDKLI